MCYRRSVSCNEVAARHPILTKLDRAKEHLAELTRELDAVSASTAPVIAGWTEWHRWAGPSWQFRWMTKDPSRRWAAIAADCVHNLRALLDQVTWDLAGGDCAPSFTSFPAYVDFDLFRERKADGSPTSRSGLHRIRGLSPAAQDAVRQLQPFAVYESERHPLWVIAELDRLRSTP